MTERRLPPADITAATFFEVWLPAAFTEAGCEAPADAPTVQVSLSGAGGGDWEITAEGDHLLVESRPPGARGRANSGQRAQVWIRQTTADFLAAFATDPDLPPLLPNGWGPLDLLFLDPRDLSLVQQIDGRLLLELTGRRRRRWALDLALGKAGMTAGRPRTTVRIDGPAYEGLSNGSLPPLKALLEKRLTVEGDRALAMQALILLGSRLSRDNR